MQQVTRILNSAGIRNAFVRLLVSIAATWTIASPSFLLAQNEAALTTATSASVPRLIRFNGTLIDGRGWPITTPVNVLFAIYSQPGGEGEPLWQETQQISPNDKGGYSVLLGFTNPAGIGIEVFKPGESQYLSIKPEGEPERPRVLLVSVPYALKAADSATLGGLPPSAFVLAGTNASTAAAISPAISPDATSTVTTTGGTANKLAKFSSSHAIISSILYDNGTEVGIGTTTPTAVLDVNGTGLFSGALSLNGGATIGGTLELAPAGTATTATGYNSQILKLYSSAYNSASKAVVNPQFGWQARPTGNNSAAPSGTLNLLSSTNNAASAPTGFSFNLNGTINFAAGQTFPGTGDGTITGVTAGTDLTGGGTSGHVTLNLDTTKIPTLAAANSFTGTQTILSGDLNLPATTSASNGVINIGGVPFLHGYKSGSANVFVGGAGNFTTKGTNNEGSGHSVLKALTSGNFNTASGDSALAANTTGSDNSAFGGNALVMNMTGGANTAIGDDALFNNSTGSNNLAVGEEALFNNFIGSNNTAIGAFSGTGQAEGLTNTTAIGYSSVVQQNNSLVLGIAQAGAPGEQFVNVGIGTSTPRSVLEAVVSASGALGPVLTLTNSGSGANTSAAIDFNTTLPAGGSYTPGARIAAVDDGLNDGRTNLILSASNVVSALGQVNIGGAGQPGPSLVIGPAGSEPFLSSPPEIAVTGCEGCTGAYIDGGAGDPGSNAGPGITAVGGFGDSADLDGEALLAWSDATFTAYFSGDILVGGTSFSAMPASRIDNPLDPANKYFVHASVQSSEMMNIYSGNVTTDELGLATVTLPEWFEAVNADFRYQLTTIGRDAHAWIAEEVANKQFKIATNASQVKVSWQVTAVRQDAYAKAHPLVVEQEKPAKERGFYQHPELYSQSAEKQTEWARHPGLMQQVEAQREAAKQRPDSSNNAAPSSPQFGPPASAVGRQFALAPKPALKPITEGRP
jgi:trimeric autotransporter adhesin